MEVNLDWRPFRSQLMAGVGCEIRPLRVWAFQELLAFWEAHAATENGAVGALKASQALALMEVAGRVLPDHVRGLEGLTLVREGRREAALVEHLSQEAPLAELAGELLARLVAISQWAEGEEKN